MPHGDDPADGAGAGGAKPLPADVREYIGRRLRSEYTIQSEKPAYLGDPGIPPKFERYVRQLESGERSHRAGVRAVSDALGVPESAVDGEDGTPPDGSAPQR